MTSAVTRLPFRHASDIARSLPRALEQLRADRLIAYPTETVYGFGGAATTAAAAALRQLKGREPFKPFVLLVTDQDQAPGVQWSDTAQLVADLFWPGPLTLVLHADAAAFPDGVRGEDGTVALRESPHPAVRALVNAWGGPLTSSSANAAGQRPARSTDEAEVALRDLDADDVLLLDGGLLPPSRPSTIVTCEGSTVRVLRAGELGTAELREALQGMGIDVE